MTARASDIGPARSPYGRFYAPFSQCIDPFPHSDAIGRLIRAARDSIDGNEVDMAKHAFAVLGQVLEGVVGVVHAFDHDVFERYPPVRLVPVLCQRSFKLGKRRIGHCGHELVSYVLLR